MSTWYYAVCDAHRVYCAVLLTFNERHYQPRDETFDNHGVAFLNEHIECDLRLVHRDAQMDAVDDYDDLTDKPITEVP